jgi:high-affinity Fe2+/Pb2+ permease
MSSESHEEGHGNSPAAWTAVVIMLVAFSVGTVAFFFDYPIVVWIAAAFVVAGFLTGVVLARMGYGVNSPSKTTHSSGSETAKEHEPGAR